jgi:hypothetical protein
MGQWEPLAAELRTLLFSMLAMHPLKSIRATLRLAAIGERRWCVDSRLEKPFPARGASECGSNPRLRVGPRNTGRVCFALRRMKGRHAGGVARIPERGSGAGIGLADAGIPRQRCRCSAAFQRPHGEPGASATGAVTVEGGGYPPRGPSTSESKDHRDRAR